MRLRLNLLRVIAALASVLPSLRGEQASCSEIPLDVIEKTGYVVRKVEIVIALVPDKLAQALKIKVVDDLPQEGKPFTVEAYERGRARIRREIRQIAPAFDSRFAITIVAAGPARCSAGPERHELDVVYVVGTTKFPSIFTNVGSVFGVEVPETFASDKQSGRGNGLTLTPLLGYNRSDRLFFGGRTIMRNEGGLLDHLQLAGKGSTSTTAVSAALSGGRDFEGRWLRRADWGLHYDFFNRPTDREALRTGTVSARVSVRTAPVGDSGRFVVLGGAFEAGNEQTRIPQEELPEDLVSSAGTGSLKAYIGSHFGVRRMTLDLSYGIQASTVREGKMLDYVKHIVDIASEARFLPSVRWMDHRPVDIETRLTAGGIQRFGELPVTERFFGGGEETEFLPGAPWRVRDNPVIRSIPPNRLNRTTAGWGLGGTSFLALNFTISTPLYRYALVPSEVSQAPDFQDQEDTQFESFFRLLAAAYNRPEAAYDRLNDLEKVLREMIAALESVTNVPATVKDDFASCRELAGDLLDTVEAIERESIAFLVRKGEERSIPSVHELCINKLNAQLGNAALTEADRNMAEIGAAIAEALERARPAAEAQARADISYSRGVFDRVVKEMNIFSVSPMFVFDLARIGPQLPGEGANRYGIGGGVRFTIANAFHVGVGYSVNPDRRLGEGRGALFFGLTVRDPLR
jgi:hypothetical protein